MAKKQTRRSVSIRGTTYDRIRSYCELEGISMSEFVEQRIAGFFDGSEKAAPQRSSEPVAKPAARPSPPRAPEPEPEPVRAEPVAAEPVRAERPRPSEAARPVPRREPVAAPRESRRAQRIAPRPAPPAKARVVAERAVGKQKLDFDEMQDAARFFTF